MSISKKRDAENKYLGLRFDLAYYFHWNIDDFLCHVDKKSSLKNYWLNKREIKDQVKEHDAKFDEIARFVTKYISSRKSQDKG